MYASPMSGAPLPVSTVEKMLDIPGFIGLKYTNSDYFLMRELKKLAGGNINVINGPDETCLLGLMMGADGAIGSTYNNMPRTFVALYNAFMAGDYETARQLQFKADDIIAIYLRYNVIAGVKAALSLEGHDVGEPNAPLPHFDAATREAFLNELKAKGFPENY
jgi:N-acetylneuraminate lyase